MTETKAGAPNPAAPNFSLGSCDATTFVFPVDSMPFDTAPALLNGFGKLSQKLFQLFCCVCCWSAHGLTGSLPALTFERAHRVQLELLALFQAAVVAQAPSAMAGTDAAAVRPVVSA